MYTLCFDLLFRTTLSKLEPVTVMELRYGIPPNVLRCGRAVILIILQNNLIACWDRRCVPGDLKDANIINLRNLLFSLWLAAWTCTPLSGHPGRVRLRSIPASPRLNCYHNALACQLRARNKLPKTKLLLFFIWYRTVRSYFVKSCCCFLAEELLLFFSWYNGSR